MGQPHAPDHKRGHRFGYQGTTVLLSSLQIPVAPLSGTITVGGDLRWLVCHDICLPQSTHLEAPIRIASATSIDEPARQLLQSAAERLPRPLPASYRPEAATAGSLPVDAGDRTGVRRADYPGGVLPREEAQIDNGARRN